VPVTPWEAALGAKVPVPLVDGVAALKLPPGAESGSRFRLRGKGMPGTGDAFGGSPRLVSAREIRGNSFYLLSNDLFNHGE